MKIFFNYLSLGLLLTTMLGCTKEVTEIQLPNIKSRPVVFCFLSPNSEGTTLTLTKTSSLNGPNNSNYDITDARVQIWQYQDTVIIPYDTNEFLYFCDSSKLKIHKGSEYFLKVTLTDNDPITSRCIIPTFEIPPHTINIIPNGQEGFDYEFLVHNTQNINAYCILQFNVPQVSGIDTIYHELDFINFQLKEGNGIFSLKAHYQIPDYFSFPTHTISSLLYTARLLICDQSTYDYLEYLHRIRNLNPSLNNIPDYTSYNISGGLGIFGGYITK